MVLMDPSACLIFRVVVIFSPPSASFSRVTCGVSTSDILDSGFFDSGSGFSTELAEVAELVLLVLLREMALLLALDVVCDDSVCVTSCFLVSAGLPPNRSLDESVTAELLSEVVDSLMEVVLEPVVVDFAKGSKSSKSPPGFEVVCKKGTQVIRTSNHCALFLQKGACL